MDIIKFGTPFPVRFKDADTNLILSIVFNGNIVINQEISEDLQQQIRLAVVNDISSQISKLSSTERYASLISHINEFTQNAASTVESKFGIKAEVQLMSLTLTEESNKELIAKQEEIMRSRLYGNTPTPNMIQSNVPSQKHCPSCGTTSSGKFCPNCGMKL